MQFLRAHQPDLNKKISPSITYRASSPIIILLHLWFSYMIFFIALQTGCSHELSPIGPARASETDLEQHQRFSAEMREHLLKEEFELLDSIAHELRTTKAKFLGGAWKLEKFYQGLEKPKLGGKDSEENWQLHLGKLGKWVDQKVDSITARVGLAEALKSYAWKVRGEGFADTVSENDWLLFKERLKQSEEILNGARKLPTKCPHWYSAMQSVALGQGWDIDRFNKLFEEAIAFEPLYPYFYSDKAVFLLPRWYGKPGDWEKFADETSQRVGGKEGSMLYSYIAFAVSKFYWDKDFFKENQVSWPKMKQGFIDREELYGSSIRNLNAFCKFACLAGDKPTARALFQRLGDSWDPDIWNQKPYFERLKAWAFE